MKKLIVLVLFGLLIVAFSAPVYAQLDFKASGAIDVNYFYWRNVQDNAAIIGAGSNGPVNGSLGNGAFDKQAQYANTRGRLKFDAAMGKEVTGTFWFEIDATKWGEAETGKDKAGKFGGDAAAMEVKNLYIDFGMPYFGIPVPMSVRLGIQGFGPRSEIVGAVDGTGVSLGFKADPVTINPYWIHGIQGKDASADDTDVLGLIGTANIGKIKVGAYGLFYDMRTFPLNLGTLTYGADPSYKARMFWFGGYTEGPMGPVNVKADFALDYGKVKTFGAADAPFSV